MLDAGEFYGPRSRKGNSTLLKGSMLPKKVKDLVIKVTGVRPAPEDWECKLILDFRFPQFAAARNAIRGALAEKATSWAVNKTDGMRLRSYLSPADDFEELVDARLRLKVVPQRDPKSGEKVPSLEVFAVALDGEDYVEYPPPAAEEVEEMEF